jgi:hypothetical protein
VNQAVSMKNIVMENETTITLSITRCREFAIRLWIARQLIRLGAWVAWMKLDVQFVEPSGQ